MVLANVIYALAHQLTLPGMKTLVSLSSMIGSDHKVSKCNPENIPQDTLYPLVLANQCPLLSMCHQYAADLTVIWQLRSTGK